jgi:hypothetical protein
VSDEVLVPTAVQQALFPLDELGPSARRARSLPFRSELTIERASLFLSNEYEGESFVRETVIPSLDGRGDIIHRLSLGLVHSDDRERGVLRQHHQDVLYKLLQLWARQGHPVADIGGKAYGHIRTTAYALVRAIYPGNDSSRTYRRVLELLQDLQSVPVVLETVYTWQDESFERQGFTILANVSWTERGVDKKGVPRKGTESTVTILLSKQVTQGFLRRQYKVMLGATYDSLCSGGKGRRSEIARLLYPFLDEQLEEQPEYAATLTELAQRFGLKQYLHASKRREKFAPAVRALDETEIHAGRHRLRVQLEEIAEPRDVLLVARRIPNA